MKLNEIFDTDLHIEPKDWKQQGRFLMTGFKLNGQGYTIQIERKPIEGISNGAEFSFFRNEIKDNEAAFSTTNTQIGPTLIYGIVANAVLPMINNFDAILITAERRHSSSEEEYNAKLRIYNTLVQRTQRKSGYRLYTIPEQYQQNNQYTEWLLSKIPPKENSLFKDEQKLALEAYLSSGIYFTLKRKIKH